MDPLHLTVRAFLQLALILGVCYVFGRVARRFGQPRVIGEMLAGIALGPSLLGWAAPAASAWLFPAASKPVLLCLAQIGLVLYMFLTGVEFDHQVLRKRLGSAASVSLAGIIAPLILGTLLAWIIAGTPGLFGTGVKPWLAMLFMGSAMSITAFPMLARIIAERGLTQTPLGTLVLAAGAVDDVAAWSILALVLAGLQAQLSLAALALGGAVAFTLFVLLGLRRMLAPLGRQVERQQSMSPDILVLALCLVMVAAWVTESLQIHAVFGAFVMGLAMPRGKFAELLHRFIHPLTTALLVPCFFVYSGLNTKIGLVDTPFLWALAGAVILVATAGKGFACYLAARGSGVAHRESMAIGALMNARGLVELIILNIGLQWGIIEPALFTIMVLMAIVTTLAATPLYQLVHGRHQAAPDTSPVRAAPEFATEARGSPL